jgi:hypothetical protein
VVVVAKPTTEMVLLAALEAAVRLQQELVALELLVKVLLVLMQ